MDRPFVAQRSNVGGEILAKFVAGERFGQAFEEKDKETMCSNCRKTDSSSRRLKISSRPPVGARFFEVQGAQGQSSGVLRSGGTIRLEQKEPGRMNAIRRPNEGQFARCTGLARALLANAVPGASPGLKEGARDMSVFGYRGGPSFKRQTTSRSQLGKSQPDSEFPIPRGFRFRSDKADTYVVSAREQGSKVGQVAGGSPFAPPGPDSTKQKGHFRNHRAAPEGKERQAKAGPKGCRGAGVVVVLNL